MNDIDYIAYWKNMSSFLKHEELRENRLVVFFCHFTSPSSRPYVSRVMYLFFPSKKRLKTHALSSIL